MDIQLILTDIDGVWTDGGMYYGNSGDEFKKFNTSDSVGVLLARTAQIPMMIITGEDEPCVRDRAKKLKIETAYFGVKDKLGFLKEKLAEMNITFDQVAFIGDEINDIPLLKRVGFSACPKSAPTYTKELVDLVIPTDGGQGAFRDFIIEILKRMNKFDHAFHHITNP